MHTVGRTSGCHRASFHHVQHYDLLQQTTEFLHLLHRVGAAAFILHRRCRCCWAWESMHSRARSHPMICLGLQPGLH